MNRAMRLSFGVGVLMLFIKVYAYWVTGSSAILADGAESIVHVFAVGFAAYSMWLSHKPADHDHTYGHDRVAFFSAGFEGVLIAIAALFIYYQAISKLIYGVTLERLDIGMFLICIATILNGFLGVFLVRRGRKFHSFVLIADGKHILTDCLTSFAILMTLFLTKLTGWLILDPLIALAVATNILWTGGRLIKGSVCGLMDATDAKTALKIREILTRETEKLEIEYHQLRHRHCGNRLLIELHLLFPDDLPVSKAHILATRLEHKIERAFQHPVELVSHLEPLESHDQVHQDILGREG